MLTVSDEGSWLRSTLRVTDDAHHKVRFRMKAWRSTYLLAVILCLAGMAAGTRATEYRRQEIVLELTRDNIDFVSDQYDWPREGLPVCTVCGIVAGVDTYFLRLVEEGWREYDLSGSLIGTIPLPAFERGYGTPTRQIVTATHFCILWDDPHSYRLAYQVYDRDTHTWGALVPLPKSEHLISSPDFVHLLPHDTMVIVFDELTGYGVSIGDGTEWFTDIDDSDIHPVDIHMSPTIAVNVAGMWLRTASWSPGEKIVYEVMSSDGTTLGTFVLAHDTESQFNRESLVKPGFAILDDGSVLHLDVRVTGSVDDRVQVVRWSP
jgi:hypothetical protein